MSQIRPATPEDAPAITGLWNHFIRDTLITFTVEEKTVAGIVAMIEEKAEKGEIFLVAEIEGAFAGFGSIGPFRGGPGYRFTFEHSIGLAEAARGRGLGRAMLRQLEEGARRLDGHVMIAGVSGANQAGLAFHAAEGYAPGAVLPEVGWKFERWLDLHLMTKRL